MGEIRISNPNFSYCAATTNEDLISFSTHSVPMYITTTDYTITDITDVEKPKELKKPDFWDKYNDNGFNVIKLKGGD